MLTWCLWWCAGDEDGGRSMMIMILIMITTMISDLSSESRGPVFNFASDGRLNFDGLRFGHKPTGGIIPNTGTHLDEFHGAPRRARSPSKETHRPRLCIMCRHMPQFLHLSGSLPHLSAGHGMPPCG